MAEATDDGGLPSATFPAGERLIRRPAHSAELSARGRVLDRATLGGSLIYMGSREDVDFNLFPAERVELPGYAIVDLATEVEVIRIPSRTSRPFRGTAGGESVRSGLRPGGWVCGARDGRVRGSQVPLLTGRPGGADRVLRSFPHDPFAVRAVLALTASRWGSSCAETSAPLPPPEEVVIVLNTAAATLSLVPVAAPTQVSTVPLGASDVLPVSVATRGPTAVVPLRGRDALAVVDLRAGMVVNTIALAPGLRGGRGGNGRRFRRLRHQFQPQYGYPDRSGHR